MGKTVSIKSVTFGGNRPFVFIAGPCVLESRAMAFHIAEALKKITGELKIPFVFKASYDKANRTSLKSFRGLGVTKGLDILADIKKKFNIPILTDVHSPREIAEAAKVVDILQIPAFLCRQTDLLVAAGKSKKVVNVKKGQFLAPWDMSEVVRKISSTGNHKILLTERGSSFGYNNLVTDFRSLAIMRQTGYPVVFDASHSVQQPGGLGTASGGKSEFIPLLARCGIAAGCDAIFMEVHPHPGKALSDGPNMLPLDKVKNVLKTLKALDKIVKQKL
ncbi:MAG: 3-deoxy-8-phosphooctulonate synthase [Candidatus Omnitrophota bacterium]|nr:3-deoxy-8-phosphooctulonate synthase [Candidatus Omnitrophota bacterium]